MTLDKLIKTITTLITIGFIIPAIIYLTIGILSISEANRLNKSCTSTTTGVIVDYQITSIGHRRHNRNLRSSYSPILEYTVEGTTYRVTSVNNSEDMGQIGKETIIYYNPQNPAESHDSDEVSISDGIISIVIGSVLLLIGPTVGMVIRKKASSAIERNAR